jgi:hypothetical protein
VRVVQGLKVTDPKLYLNATDPNVTDSDWFMEKLAELVFCPISSMYYKKMNLLSLVLLLVNNKKNYKMNGGSVTVFFLFLFHMKQANSSENSVI